MFFLLLPLAYSEEPAGTGESSTGTSGTSSTGTSSTTIKPPAEPVAWKDGPFETRYETDFTAYTLPKRAHRLGILHADYGLLDNATIGTMPIFWLLGYANINAKVTAISLPNFDISLEGGVGRADRNLGTLPVTLTAFPVDFTASYILAEQWSVHGGLAIQNFELSTQLSVSEMAENLAAIAGVDLSEDLAAVADGKALYGGGHLTLLQPHFALDVRFNRRDSLVYQWRGTTWMSARFDAGVDNGEDFSAGVAFSIRKALGEAAIGTNSLSWQFSWEHCHLRLGVGSSKPYSAGLGLLQANELYFVF